jgi:hypothetical protein
MSRAVGYDEGEGALCATFNIHETTAGTPDLTLASNLGHVVTMTGNNEVGVGADTKMLAGKVVAFSPEGTECTVQVKGVIKDVPYATGTLPAVGNTVQMSAANQVDVGAALTICRGMVLNVDTTAVTCDILL